MSRVRPPISVSRRERRIVDILYRRGRATAPGRPRRSPHTFFDGSSEQAVAALLGGEATSLSDDDLKRIADLVSKARKDG
jgi:hypothetical protein